MLLLRKRRLIKGRRDKQKAVLGAIAKARGDLPTLHSLLTTIQDKNMDAIQLTGIRVYGYTGYLQEERDLGQWFEVDVRLSVDLTTAGKSDRIEDTLDYRGAISDIKRIVSTAKYALVERLADELVTTLLSYELVHKVELKLYKPHAPIPDFGGKITIELTRTK
jgi:7,8-dihydroneopterin aldolase/epimerase/oxygenase